MEFDRSMLKIVTAAGFRVSFKPPCKFPGTREAYKRNQRKPRPFRSYKQGRVSKPIAKAYEPSDKGNINPGLIV